MLYIGLDVHTKRIAVCVLNSNGKVVRRCQVQSARQLMELLEELPGPFQVCYEASTGYGRYFELLRPLAARVVVAHPGALKLIFRSKQKNDRRDAHQLAKLLYLDAVPAVHVPSANVRDWRQLITFRRKLVEKRTRSKNGIREVLRTHGITASRRPGLWTKKGLIWLQQLELNPLQALRRDMLLEEIQTLSNQLAQVEKQLQLFSRDNASVWQLRSIPGIGLRTAEAVVAFIDDPHRFSHSKQVGAYFGLVPSQDQSGPTNRLGHITKEGSATVRHLLVESGWQAASRSPTVAAYLARIQRGDKDRRKIAIVATAHYLVRVMWAMLREGTMWRETTAAA